MSGKKYKILLEGGKMMPTKEEQANVMRCCPNINKDIVFRKS